MYPGSLRNHGSTMLITPLSLFLLLILDPLNNTPLSVSVIKDAIFLLPWSFYHLTRLSISFHLFLSQHFPGFPSKRLPTSSDICFPPKSIYWRSDSKTNSLVWPLIMSFFYLFKPIKREKNLKRGGGSHQIIPTGKRRRNMRDFR
jgi:hypothetical protein